MTSITNGQHGGHGWQLIFADLALILFLLTLSALPAAESKNGERLADTAARKKDALGAAHPQVAPSQALFRPVPDGPSLAVWLAAQTPDPRATLTIFATHTKAGQAAAWARAEALASEARASGTRVRTIITAGAAEDTYASLAYDEVIAESTQEEGRKS